MSKFIYFIELTETTKAFPKKEFYKCEICGILQTSENLISAFFTENKDFAHELSEHIESNFDYFCKVIEFRST